MQVTDNPNIAQEVSFTFTVSVESFETIKFTRNLEENYPLIIVRFYSLGLQLSRWGYSRGLAGNTMDQEKDYWELHECLRRLRRILDCFERAQVKSDKLQPVNPVSRSKTRAVGLDRRRNVIEDSFRRFAQKAMQKYTTMHKLRWIVHEPEVLEKLVADLHLEVKIITDMFPKHIVVPEDTLVKEEIQESSDDVLLVLQKLNEGDRGDKPMKNLVEAEIKNRHISVGSFGLSGKLLLRYICSLLLSLYVVSFMYIQLLFGSLWRSSQSSMYRNRRSIFPHWERYRDTNTKHQSNLDSQMKYGSKRTNIGNITPEPFTTDIRLKMMDADYRNPIRAETSRHDEPRTLASILGDLNSTLEELCEETLEILVQQSAKAISNIKALQRFTGMGDLASMYRNYKCQVRAKAVQMSQYVHKVPSPRDIEIADALFGSLLSEYTAALQTLGLEQFCTFHDQALSEFSAELKLEDWKLHQSLCFPENQSRRTHISERIIQRLRADSQLLDSALARSRLVDLEPKFRSLTQKTSFKTLKDSLYCLLARNSTIESVLRYKNVEMIRHLLKTRFEQVAQGQYEWLDELKKVGYEPDEIAELLFEQAFDAPWIIYESKPPKSTAIKLGSHLDGCIHKYPGTHLPDPTHSSSMPLEPVSITNLRDVQEDLERLCGVAGVTPCGRDRLSWGGFVKFDEENTVATVSFYDYESFDHEENERTMRIIRRIKGSLERLCCAAGQAQSAGLCCDSFTMIQLRRREHELDGTVMPVAEVSRVDFGLVQDLLKNIDSLNSRDHSKILLLALTVLHQVTQEIGTSHLPGDGDALHACALATQALCLGFVSYMNAHSGPMRPCILDTALKKVRLLGSKSSASIGLEASLLKLTCFNGVVQSPVFAFQMIELESSLSSPSDQEPTYDLLATIEDIIDTWGPAQLIINPKDNTPFAISIGCGVIYTEDFKTNKLHWSRNVSPESVDQSSLGFSKKYVIGVRVKINDHCLIRDIEQCRQNSSASLVPIGTQGPCWVHDERQGGISAGQWLCLQIMGTLRKLPGRSLKQHIIEESDTMLLDHLHEVWAVQVSFCTHIARRVPLREMIADLLPIFAAASSSPNDDGIWNELQRQNIEDAFRQEGVSKWLRGLPEHLHRKVLQMVRDIMKLLYHTGLDRERKNFVVAWPHASGLSRCFRVRVEHQSSWTEVLADSEDSAAFCYIVTKCLETDKITCKGPNPVWNREILLLETAVVLHERDPEALTTMLTHDKSCYFQKMDELFFVRVLRPVANGDVNLVTRRSLAPRAVQIRLMGKNGARLRERIVRGELGEDVAVSYMPVSAF